MNTPTPNWQPVFFDFLVSALFILLLFRFIRYVLPLLLAKKKKVIKVSRYLPVAETIAWLLFFSWYTFKFAEIMSIYAFVVIAVLFILVFWISRFFLKDLIAGLFFRTSGRFKEGEVISLENYKGFIRRFGLQSLEIESQEGQIIFLPYSKLLESNTIKNESEEQSAAYSFTFDIKAGLSREETVNEIRTFLISMPWSSVQKIPHVVLKEGSGDHYSVEVTAFPIEKEHGKRIEHLCIREFAGQ